jgi:hypothetical protein
MPEEQLYGQPQGPRRLGKRPPGLMIAGEEA